MRVSRKGAWLHFVRGIGSGEAFASTLDGVFALPTEKLPELRAALKELAAE
ncbi:MAG TPA: hypothetical protein VLA09_02535 [Longimicrobiales bacterium]|nr:hypothetical protein [Longimicrobiales bacterium]